MTTSYLLLSIGNPSLMKIAIYINYGMVYNQLVEKYVPVYGVPTKLLNGQGVYPLVMRFGPTFVTL